MCKSRIRFREAFRFQQVKGTSESHRLMRIWRNSKYEDARFEIVNKLEDQSGMAVIALGDPSDSVRAEAVKRLEDKTLLLRISLEDRSDFVRAMARAHFEYEGPEPWLSMEDDEEVQQEILDYLMRNSEPAEQNGADVVGGRLEACGREKSMLRHMRAAK